MTKRRFTQAEIDHLTRPPDRTRPSDLAKRVSEELSTPEAQEESRQSRLYQARAYSALANQIVGAEMSPETKDR